MLSYMLPNDIYNFFYSPKNGAQKLLGISIAFGQAVGYVLYGLVCGISLFIVTNIWEVFFYYYLMSKVFFFSLCEI